MTIYIPMIILTVFLADIQERIRYRGRKISILLITLLPPTLVAAFRYNNGADYPMYFQLFTRLGNGSKIAGIEGKKLEVGFEYIVRLCQLVTRNQWFTFGAISFIISFLIFKECLNDSDDYRLSVLFYFVTGVYFDAYNGLRQYIAVSICFYSPSAEYKRVPDKIINKAKQWSEQYPKKIEFQEAYFGLLFSRLKYAQAQDMRNEQRRVYREMKTVAERANYSEYNESNQLMESVDILHRVFGY